MKRACLSLIAASLLASAASAQPQDQISVSVPTVQLKYGSTGVTDGAHGTFLKMPGGFVSPLHTHTSDEWGVIIAGVFANGKPGNPDILLPAGSYFFQKAGEA